MAVSHHCNKDFLCVNRNLMETCCTNLIQMFFLLTSIKSVFWVVWFLFHFKVSCSDSSDSGRNLLSVMLCPVLFLLPPLLNNSKGFVWLWFHFCSVYDCNPLSVWLSRVWILLLSLAAPPPDFEKIDFCCFQLYFVLVTIT